MMCGQATIWIINNVKQFRIIKNMYKAATALKENESFG